jgi:hypothetical protein
MPAILLAIISSRIGQIGLAFLTGWMLAWWKTDASWRETVAKERAAQEYALQVERIRQDAAAREIAAEATKRLEDEQASVAEMAKQIEDLKRSEANAPKNCPSCRVDDDFVNRMRQLDSAGRKARPSRPAKHIR